MARDSALTFSDATDTSEKLNSIRGPNIFMISIKILINILHLISFKLIFNIPSSVIAQQGLRQP